MLTKSKSNQQAHKHHAVFSISTVYPPRWSNWSLRSRDSPPAPNQPDKKYWPKVHIFCRDPSKLAPDYQKRCASIFKGDARSAESIQRAIADSDADVVILAVGNGDNTGRTDIRTANAQAVAAAMQQPGMEHVKAVVLSSHGAGPTKVIVGLGIGKLIEYHLRHVFKDHDGQESAFLDNGLANRVVIVRPTSLTDGKANGKITEFGNTVKSPTLHIDRGDVAMYVAKEACSSSFAGGKAVNICGQK